MSMTEQVTICPEPGCGLQVWNYMPGTIRCPAGHVYQRAGLPGDTLAALQLEAIRERPCERRHLERWQVQAAVSLYVLLVGAILALALALTL